MDWHHYSAYPQLAAAIAIVIMRWVEWGHVPYWEIIAWVLCAGFNIYHIFCLIEYHDLAVNPPAEEDETEMAAVDDDESEIEEEFTEFSDARLRSVTKQALLLVNSME